MNSTSLRHSVAAITAPRNPESIRASLKRKKHTTVWSDGRHLKAVDAAAPYGSARAQLEAKNNGVQAQMPHVQFRAERIRLAPMQELPTSIDGTTTWRPSALSQARHNSPPFCAGSWNASHMERQSKDPTSS
ncbi:hypothetical protein TcBrA4_0013690 [Trypanosoma cruzi]|nr:hypothetical protein TcBrA4_0013690 [Trypanosoma cruzi]